MGLLATCDVGVGASVAGHTLSSRRFQGGGGWCCGGASYRGCAGVVGDDAGHRPLALRSAPMDYQAEAVETA